MAAGSGDAVRMNGRWRDGVKEIPNLIENAVELCVTPWFKKGQGN